VLLVVRSLLSIAALEHYSLTTVLFPGMLAISNLLFVLLVVQRRFAIRPAGE
jgi:hypothetical protein